MIPARNGLAKPFVVLIFGWILSSVAQAYWNPARTTGDQGIR